MCMSVSDVLWRRRSMKSADVTGLWFPWAGPFSETVLIATPRSLPGYGHCRESNRELMMKM